MKITDVEILVLRLPNLEIKGDGSQDAVIVRIHTDEGIIGVGEADSSPYIVNAIINTPSSHSASRGIKEVLIGEDPLEIELLWEKLYKETIYYGRRGVGIHALSAIDIALWDIAGKYYGVPICKLLGGCYRNKVKAYSSVLMPEDEYEVEKKAAYFAEQGYLGLKFGWGALGKDDKLDIKLVKAVRRAIGDTLSLQIDIGMEWKTAAHAIEMCRRMEEFNLFWIEEPLSPDDIEGYRKLKEKVYQNIAAGEELTTRFEFWNLMDQGKVDIIQPDISRCGGITEAKRIAQLAEFKSTMLVPHGFSTGILVAASLHFLAAQPNGELMEFCRSGSPLNSDLLVEPIKFEDGHLSIPTGSGLGIELNEEVLNKYLYKKIRY
ncbi:MAG: mandelate racemase [Desulfitibacter sp. BRH_c19]|nr:MAG: mandelate racemase [Desulfitibacter sp. BRH_c19]